MLRKLLALVGAILVLSVVAVAVIAARQRPPAIDGSDGGAEPLAWWSRKAIQGMFDYRVWSGARSGRRARIVPICRMRMQDLAPRGRTGR